MAIVSNFPEKRGLNTDDINDIANGEISNGFVQSQFNYFTEEQVIGKWIDGKPLYQKTITYTNNSSAGEVTINTGLTSGTYIVRDIKGITVRESGDKATFPIPFVGLTQAGALNGEYTNFISYPADGTISYRRSSSAIQSGAKTYITIQYTKTTD